MSGGRRGLPRCDGGGEPGGLHRWEPPRRAGGEGMAPSGRFLGGDGVVGWPRFAVVRRKGAALPWWCVLGSVVRGAGVWLGFECCLFQVF